MLPAGGRQHRGCYIHTTGIFQAGWTGTAEHVPTAPRFTHSVPWRTVSVIIWTFCSLTDSVILNPPFRYLHPCMSQAFPLLCDLDWSCRVLGFSIDFFSNLLFRNSRGRFSRVHARCCGRKRCFYCCYYGIDTEKVCVFCVNRLRTGLLNCLNI